jgi:predicted deacylase
MNLFNNIKWKTYNTASTAAYGTVSLKVGLIGENPPSSTIIAGVHGDEGPWSALAIKNVLETIQMNELVGSIKIIPVANPTAMEIDSRVSPIDNLDLNRVFPGDTEGSHSQRIAAIITKHALDGSDYVFDLHGGGSWCVNSFAFSFKGSEDLIAAINPPFIVQATEKPGTLTGYSMTKGAKVTSIEMGGRCQAEKEWINKTANCLKRGLNYARVINCDYLEDPTSKSQFVGPTTVIRSNVGGIFIPTVKEDSISKVLDKDTILGSLLNPVTMNCEEIYKTPFEETAIMLLRPRVAVVDGGAMIYVVAPLTE